MEDDPSEHQEQHWTRCGSAALQLVSEERNPGFVSHGLIRVNDQTAQNQPNNGPTLDMGT